MSAQAYNTEKGILFGSKFKKGLLPINFSKGRLHFGLVPSTSIETRKDFFLNFSIDYSFRGPGNKKKKQVRSVI